MTNNTLVLGGTGKTGHRVARRLARRGLPVRIGSRSARPPFDWDDPATWESALADVQSVYVSYYPDLAVPGATAAIGSFIEVAMAAGARRLVLLSGRGEEEAQACEKLMANSGADWTVLRCGWFSQNFSEGYLLDPVLAGDVALPAGDVSEPFVDADDIADAAEVVLTEEGHLGQVYELTGPRLLTFAEAVATIADAAGRDITFAHVPVDGYAAALTAAGHPASIVDFVTYLFVTVLDGRNEYLTDGVQRVLRREARDFGTYARAAAATGVWRVPA